MGPRAAQSCALRRQLAGQVRASCPSRLLGSRARASSRGQALLIAVLVLFAVGTLAALFTAIVGSQLTQVTRQSDVVALRNIAEAGLRLANEQLTYSPLGADWRPSVSPYQCGDGEVRVEVTYGPSPDQLQSRFLKIVSTAAFPDNPFLRHTILALKPMLLTDYARFITDRFETNRPASLGVAGIELNGAERTDFISYLEGPIRSNAPLVWYGQSQLNLRTPFDEEVDWADLGILRDDRIEVAGGMRARAPELDLLRLVIDGQPRADTSLFAPQNPTEAEDYTQGFPRWWNEQVSPNTRTVLASLPDYQAVRGAALEVPRIRPPEIDAIHPDKETNRYLSLTQDSGFWRQEGEAWYNTGEFGWGWGNYGGIYIDNGPYVDADGNAHPGDLQYYDPRTGEHDLELLRLNWTRSVGVHRPAGDRRVEGTSGPPAGPADWWDKTARYYAPPGAEIILHGENTTCPWVEIIRHDLRPDRSGAQCYWMDPEGYAISPNDPDRDVPYSLSYRYEPEPGACTPSAAELPPGIYDGNRAVFPYPPNGVIYAEGSIRISGIMPPVRNNLGQVGTAIPADQAPEAYFGDWDDVRGRTRRFDLQVVSGGTTYVEGDLLTPSTAQIAGLTPGDWEQDKGYGSRLALLARDYVCVNTTALNPTPTQVFATVQDAAGAQQHYNDLQAIYPPGDWTRYGLFRGVDASDWTATPAAPRPALPRPTEPAPQSPEVVMAYRNVRLSETWNGPGAADVRLILGHSGGFFSTAESDVARPPLDLGERVELVVTINGEQYLWSSKSGYSFVASAPGEDESDHWYNDWDTPPDYLEFLPLPGREDMRVRAYLTGDDLLSFAVNVTPVPNSDNTGWDVDPRQLGYVLGPVAIAPPREASPLPVEIEALVYAQNGSWFIIPGPWFNEDESQADEPEPTRDYPTYHEPLNIQIRVHGAISENMTADLGSVADWTGKWSGPAGQDGAGFLSYQYDPLLRYPRRETENRIGYLRFPNFPITSDLVIWGERVSGPAGS